MSKKIIYFSRSGTSEKVAKKISEKLNVSKLEVIDDKDWSGLFGWIKAGYYASKEKLVNIKVDGVVNSDDHLIVITPLWAGKLTPAIRTLLKKYDLTNIDLVVCSKGSKLKSRTGYNSIYDIIKSKNNESKVIEELVKNLK